MGLAILEQLREQTRPAHQALEAQPLLKSLMSSQLTDTQYRQLLQSMLMFYRSLESELVPAAAALLRQHPDPEYRYLPRAPVLENDCRVLGCTTSGFIHSPVEFQLDKSEAYLVGVLYVIEGSTQGGRMIARHLAHILGVSENSGAGFFNIYRYDNSWAAFRRWLSSDLAYNHQDEIKSAIEGANMTFTALHTHLDQWQPLTHGN